MVTIDTNEQAEAVVLLSRRLAEATQQGKLKWQEEMNPSFGRDFSTRYGDVTVELTLHSDGEVCAIALKKEHWADSVYIPGRRAGEEVKNELAKLAKAVMPAGVFSAFPSWVEALHKSLA